MKDRLDKVEANIKEALKDKLEAEKRTKEFIKEQTIKAKLEAAAYPCDERKYNSNEVEIRVIPTHKKKTF